MGVIKYSGMYSVAVCRANPDLTFVFGDNTVGFGKGGQAIIRDEPNAYGVPTKRYPSMDRSAFFREGDPDGLPAILEAIKGLWDRLKEGKSVVIPMTPEGEVSLGMGLAKLNETAPSLYGTIVLHVEEMVASYGERHAEDDSQLAS